MPRVTWPLHRDRPCVEVVLTRTSDGQAERRRLLADTGAGTRRSGFETVLHTDDCTACGVRLAQAIGLSGAIIGRFPLFLVHVQVPGLGVTGDMRAVAVPSVPAGFDGIAAFRFLMQFTYGSFGDSDAFGLET